MKRTVILTFIMVFSISVLKAQMDRNHKIALSSYEVPTSVLESQKFNFPNGYVTKWSKYTNLPVASVDDYFYISNFKHSGVHSFKAYFDQEGNVIAKMTFMPSFELPEMIQESVNNSYLNTRIKSGDLIKLYDLDIEIYRVRINTEGLLQYVYYDRYAKMLNPQRLPYEVMFLN